MEDIGIFSSEIYKTFDDYKAEYKLLQEVDEPIFKTMDKCDREFMLFCLALVN